MAGLNLEKCFQKGRLFQLQSPSNLCFLQVMMRHLSSERGAWEDVMSFSKTFLSQVDEESRISCNLKINIYEESGSFTI